MWNQLLTAISRAGIFMVCAQTLVHCRPRASYEKYIKLLVSVMLLAFLCEPLLKKAGSFDWEHAFPIGGGSPGFFLGESGMDRILWPADPPEGEAGTVPAIEIPEVEMEEVEMKVMEIEVMEIGEVKIGEKTVLPDEAPGETKGGGEG